MRHGLHGHPTFDDGFANRSNPCLTAATSYPSTTARRVRLALAASRIRSASG
jgi:hypothetical protein